MSGTLDGRVAVVTGASRGIGREVARLFAAEGAAVVVAARSTAQHPGRLPGTIDETVSSITASGGRAIAVEADLTEPGDREHLIAVAEQAFGTVDILVNNAAITYFSPASEFRPDRARLMFDIGVHAPLHLCQLVLPGMRSSGRGWICNVTSDVARHPRVPPSRHGATGTTTVYGMCKSALERLTTGLAAEVYGSGVAVNALGPTKVVPTPGTIFHGVTSESDPNSESPAVMAMAALSLCSADPGSLTGRIVHSQEILAELGIVFPAIGAMSDG